MIRAFLDTSVLFAASYSPTGASRELIRLAFQGQVQLVISDDVLEEARRNLAAKLPNALDLFQQIVELIPFEIVTPTLAEVQRAAMYTEQRCTHCGACVTVCPPNAFEVDPVTRRILFYGEKYVACELCIKACPPRAMEVHF